MKRRLFSRVLPLALVLAICIIGVSGLSKSSRTNSTASTIAELSWISGRWQTVPGGKVQIEEHWMAPAGNSMLGMSRTIVGDRTVEFEYVRLEQRAEAIYYVAHPKARCPGTDFKLTRLTPEEAVFENPGHDFPKRIIYRKGSDGSLTASIDGGEGTKSQTFRYVPMAK